MAARSKAPIGVFDSGLGGISVLKALVEALPHESFSYFGDSAFAPYGERDREWVLGRSRAIVDALLDDGCKAVVIACNTATSAAAAALRAEYAHVPIIGVEPALKPAALSGQARRILVMATPITLRLDKYQQLAARWAHGLEVIDAPCPGLAARIERGSLDGADLVDLLEGLIGAWRGKVDACVLGCTHYPFVSRQIRAILGDVPLYDGARGTARQLERKLAERGLLARLSAPGAISFGSSKPGADELALYEHFFSLPIDRDDAH